jgi:hypothetical protein
MDLLERFFGLFKPIKSVFSLYLLMYLFPLSIPVIIAMSMYDLMIIENKINTPVAIIVGICGFLSFFWTLFFLLYFTKQRNSKPELYEKGFMSELSVKGGDNG